MNTMKVTRVLFSARFFTAAAVAALLISTPILLRAQDPSSGPPPAGYNDQQDQQQDPQADPPSRVGRLSILQGNVSFQPANAENFGAAELNYPLTTGDRLYTDDGALAEVEAGQLAVRLGQQTDLTVTSLTDDLAQFGLAQGSVHLRAYSLDPGTTTELDTPNASITLLQSGDARIDVLPNNVTVVAVLSGQVQVNADGVQQTLQAGKSLQISGENQPEARFVNRARADGLDSFSAQRDAAYQQAFSSEQNYVDPNTIGSADLAAYGDWDNSSADYGAVWYPRGVAADWAPYSTGRWVSIAPWGWTWVGAEPWGFAPFHYGRWNRFGNRWGWIPGPPRIRPYYSPALVVFVGGGSGVAAWFPLGPREVYRPWYRTSAVYVNRVNVTNIYNRNPVQVRSIYNNRSNFYRNTPVNYVNRGVATIAVPQRNFGSGRSVREGRVDSRQLQGAPILNRPPVATPVQSSVRRPASALPPRGTQRPVLDSRGDQNRGPQRGGFNGGNPGGRPVQGQNPGAAQPDRGGNSPAQIVRPGTPRPQPQPGSPGQTDRNDGNRGNDNGNRNGGRFDGRTPNQPQVAPGQAPVAPGQPNLPARPVRPQPAQGGQNNQNDQTFRPGPGRQPAPDGTIRMDQPRNNSDQPRNPAQPRNPDQPQNQQQPQLPPRFQRPQPAAPVVQQPQQAPQVRPEPQRPSIPRPEPQRQPPPMPQRQAPSIPERQAPPQPQREAPQPPHPVQPMPQHEAAPPPRPVPQPRPSQAPEPRPQIPRPQPPAEKK